MACARHVAAAGEHGIARVFLERPQRRPRCGIADGIVRPVIGIGAVKHIVCAVVPEDIGTLRPAASGLTGSDRTALPLGLSVGHGLRRRQKKTGLADDSREIGREFHTVDPALLYRVVELFFAGPYRDLALHRVTRATTRKIEICLARRLVEKHIGINDRIFGSKERPVVKVGKGAAGIVGHGHAYLEVLLVAGILTARAGAVKEIVAAVAFIHLGRPELAHIPRRAVGALVDLTARSPLRQI